ncbi:MAG: N-acetylmuramoyl-L-alanine amidase [Candidatus Xenobiia bacterium LiM19]
MSGKVAGFTRFFFMILLVFCVSGSGAACGDNGIELVKPDKDLWVKAGDQVQITVKGPSGSQGSFSIVPFVKSAPLCEERPGFYTGAFRIDGVFEKAVEGTLSVSFSDKKLMELPRKIRVLSSVIPTVGSCIVEKGVLRAGPGDDFDRIGELPAAVKVEIAGKYGEWYRIRPGGAEFWISERSIRLLPEGALSDEPVLRGITSRREGSGSAMELSLDGRCAYSLSETLSPPALCLVLYGTSSSVLEEVYRPDNTVISHIDSAMNSPGRIALRINLTGSSIWGYESGFNGNVFSLKLKAAPVLEERGSLGGLTVIVDPGHGGRDPGAVGKGGLEEKKANLALALELRNLLEKSGAAVVLTREIDCDMTPPGSSVAEGLQARVVKGKECKGDIFVSIHNNAKADVAEGRIARGTYTYFYHPHSLELARAINAHLSGDLSEVKSGHIARSFHVIRQSYMPAVLVEVTFISNPGEEIKLQDEIYIKKAARSIYKGIVDFAGSSCRYVQKCNDGGKVK